MINPKDFIRNRLLQAEGKPVSRNSLCWGAGAIGDRKMRRIISELVIDEGLGIVNLQSGDGYFLTDDPELLLAQSRLNTSRFAKLLQKNKVYDKLAQQALSNQMKVEDK